MIYEVPKNGINYEGDTTPPWQGATKVVFDQDGGLQGMRRGPFSNIVNIPVDFGNPDKGTAGSPRLAISDITFLATTRIRSAYQSSFLNCWWNSAELIVDVGPRDTWPSAFDFVACHVTHSTLKLELADFRFSGSIERCGNVVLGLDKIGSDEWGGGYVVARFESDGDQVVEVKNGVTVIATQATNTTFRRHPGAGPVVLMDQVGSKVIDLPGAGTTPEPIAVAVKPWWMFW